MNPDEMTDEQLMRTVTVAIAAVSGTCSSVGGLIATAEVLARYIETGESPPQRRPQDPVDWVTDRGRV